MLGMVQTVQNVEAPPAAAPGQGCRLARCCARQGLSSDSADTISPVLFSDKVVDVPVTFNDTCPWRSRQCSCWTRMWTCPVLCTTGAFVVQTVQFWTSVDEVPVVAHDREMPQIQFFARV